MNRARVGLLIVACMVLDAVMATPVLQGDPHSGYAPDPAETSMTQAGLARAMAPVDDATFWTILLLERKQKESAVRELLLSLKDGVGDLVPDWLKQLKDEAAAVVRRQRELKRENTRIMTQLSAVMEENLVPEARLLKDSHLLVSRSPVVSTPVPNKETRDKREKKGAVDSNVPLSRLFLRNSQPGLYGGGQRFSGLGDFMNSSANAWMIQRGGQALEKSETTPISGRIERIRQWFGEFLGILTGIYTYLALGAFFLGYLLVRYLVHGPRLE